MQTCPRPQMSEEHNEDMGEGNILECLSPGIELKTNIIRKANCVVSLGPEKVEVAEEEEGEEAEEEEEEGALRDAGAVDEDDDEEGEEEEAPAEGDGPAV